MITPPNLPKTSKRAPARPTKKHEISIVRSSAVDYLNFAAATGQSGVDAVFADASVWLTQKMPGVLYGAYSGTWEANVPGHRKPVDGLLRWVTLMPFGEGIYGYKDTLSKSYLEACEYDIVMANPPFTNRAATFAAHDDAAIRLPLTQV